MPDPSPLLHALLTRRAAMGALALGAAGAAGAALSPDRAAAAESAPKLAVHDPAAMAVGYVEDAARVDAAKYPKFVPGSSCENCMQLQGRPGDPYRPCTLFPGKLVSVSGWCSAWMAEM